MLNIYYGDESIDKEKFIFEHVKGRTLLLVPDQFSLQAERDAFFYLGAESLMDLAVVDFSSLGYKVLRETGGGVPPLIDRYGRHMLLSGIIGRKREELKVYRNSGGKSSFVEMVNDFISDMKRSDIGAERLEAAAGDLDGENFLRYKIDDMLSIFREYEEAIDGRYLDSEDYITFYGNRLLESRMVAESDVWIYGFDTFTPRNMLVMERLLKRARSLNVVLTYREGGDRGGKDASFLFEEDGDDLFSITGYIMRMLEMMGDVLNEDVSIEAIEAESKPSVWEHGMDDVTMACVSNIYDEADRAASYITGLVRDGGYRYGDIVVACNDTDVRMGVLQRTFLKWGIPVFVDRKRKVMHHPAVGFVLALCETAAFGYRDEAVMKLIKSGLLAMSEEEGEKLENYAGEFRIRGNMWKKPFTRTGDSYEDEEVERLNELRVMITDVITGAKEAMGRYNTAGEKIRGLYGWLSDDFDMKGRLKEIMDEQREGGFSEGADENAQSWSVICTIFDQIQEIMGDEKISARDLLRMMESGFREVEIGLVPEGSDNVIIGTLQRTRLSRIKALVITGACDGLLPMERKDEGILSDREKIILEEINAGTFRNDRVMMEEERLAIYRMFSHPSERIYISCAMTDEKGEAARPSAIFDRLEERLIEAGGRVLGDLQDEDVPDVMSSPQGSLSYMTEALRAYRETGKIDPRWLYAAGWYEENEPAMLRKVKKGFAFDNTQEIIGRDIADAIYRGDRENIETSISRLEKYSSCPFAHFIMYGLRPDEGRVFEMGPREIGDIYHECIMRFCLKFRERLTSGEDLTRKQCDDEIDRILDEDMEGYREGLVHSGRNEEYRLERIRRICSQAAWSIAGQIKKGQIREMFFEESFGRQGTFPPVRIDAGARDVLIRGRIDRIDVLDVEHGDDEGRAVRIIDYKTGGDQVDLDYLRKGYKLQLMIYLKAAEHKYKVPAGVFLFRINENDADADGAGFAFGEDARDTRIESSFRLEGIVMDEPELIEAMDGDFDKRSDVIPVKRVAKTGGYGAAGGGYLLTKDEFDQLSKDVDRQVERICREICEGDIGIRPKREKKKDMDGRFMNSCRFCRYRSICVFDTSFRGCRFENV